MKSNKVDYIMNIHFDKNMYDDWGDDEEEVNDIVNELMLGVDETVLSELKKTGIDIDKFVLMDNEEKYKALIDAGVNLDTNELLRKIIKQDDGEKDKTV